MLTTCTDCGGKVSSEAPSCPHCRKPMKSDFKVHDFKPNQSEPLRVKDEYPMKGFLGKPGTKTHQNNVIVLTLLIAGAFVFVAMFFLKSCVGV